MRLGLINLQTNGEEAQSRGDPEGRRDKPGWIQDFVGIAHYERQKWRGGWIEELVSWEVERITRIQLRLLCTT